MPPAAGCRGERPGLLVACSAIADALQQGGGLAAPLRCGGPGVFFFRFFLGGRPPTSTGARQRFCSTVSMGKQD